MNDCKPEPTTSFESCVDKKIMDDLKEKLGIDPLAPIILFVTDKYNNIKWLAEVDTYKPGLPEIKVGLEYLDCISITRSHGSNHTTITTGGNSYSEEVDGW